jgi:hypothetical protein
VGLAFFFFFKFNLTTSASSAFLTGSHYVAQAGLELAILLPPAPEC